MKFYSLHMFLDLKIKNKQSFIKTRTKLRLGKMTSFLNTFEDRIILMETIFFREMINTIKEYPSSKAIHEKEFQNSM